MLVVKIFGNFSSATGLVFLGNGDGTLQPQVTYLSGGEDYATSVAAADFNGDGKPDLAVAVGCAKSGCANGTVGVLLNTNR